MLTTLLLALGACTMSAENDRGLDDRTPTYSSAARIELAPATIEPSTPSTPSGQTALDDLGPGYTTRSQAAPSPTPKVIIVPLFMPPPERTE